MGVMNRIELENYLTLLTNDMPPKEASLFKKGFVTAMDMLLPEIQRREFTMLSQARALSTLINEEEEAKILRTYYGIK